MLMPSVVIARLRQLPEHFPSHTYKNVDIIIWNAPFLLCILPCPQEFFCRAASVASPAPFGEGGVEANEQIMGKKCAKNVQKLGSVLVITNWFSIKTWKNKNPVKF